MLFYVGKYDILIITTAVILKHTSIGDRNEGIFSDTFADADAFRLYCDRIFGGKEQATSRQCKQDPCKNRDVDILSRVELYDDGSFFYHRLYRHSFRQSGAVYGLRCTGGGYSHPAIASFR